MINKKDLDLIAELMTQMALNDVRVFELDGLMIERFETIDEEEEPEDPEKEPVWPRVVNDD